MKKNIGHWLAGIAALLPFTSVLAHPGHGHKDFDGNSVFHYVTEPVHLISFCAIVVVFFVGRSFFIKYKKKSKAEKASGL